MNKESYRPTTRRAPAREVRLTDKQFLALTSRHAPSLHRQMSPPRDDDAVLNIIASSSDMVRFIQ